MSIRVQTVEIDSDSNEYNLYAIMTYIGLSMTFCMYLTHAQVPVSWKIFSGTKKTCWKTFVTTIERKKNQDRIHTESTHQQTAFL